jgi:D-arabinose 1-dehydrogenase-like Zn-dependent alcohol dehydrogenase
VNLLKVPDKLSDKKVILLSDIMPTAWHANELAQVGKGDRVAIWGAGPGEATLLLHIASDRLLALHVSACWPFLLSARPCIPCNWHKREAAS